MTMNKTVAVLLAVAVVVAIAAVIAVKPRFVPDHAGDAAVQDVATGGQADMPVVDAAGLDAPVLERQLRMSSRRCHQCRKHGKPGKCLNRQTSAGNWISAT